MIDEHALIARSSQVTVLSTHEAQKAVWRGNGRSRSLVRMGMEFGKLVQHFQNVLEAEKCGHVPSDFETIGERTLHDQFAVF